MMSAKAISAKIRAKKKFMQDNESGAVKLSGIPEDAIDILTNKGHEEGERLSQNAAPNRDEEPELDTEVAEEERAQPHQDTQEMARDASHMAEGGMVRKIDGYDASVDRQDEDKGPRGGEMIDGYRGDTPAEDSATSQHGGDPDLDREVLQMAKGGMAAARRMQIRSMLGRMRK